MGCPHYASGSWCEECKRDELLGVTPSHMQGEAFRQSAGQAMHDLLVWAACQGFDDGFDAAYQRGYDDASGAWARGVK